MAALDSCYNSNILFTLVLASVESLLSQIVLYLGLGMKAVFQLYPAHFGHYIMNSRSYSFFFSF